MRDQDSGQEREGGDGDGGLVHLKLSASFTLAYFFLQNTVELVEISRI